MNTIEERSITCIICPMGCRAKLTIVNGRISMIENLECAKGEEYAIKEFETPLRDFFTTIRIRGAKHPLLPVRATQAIPKDKVMAACLELAKTTVDAPIKVGDIVIKNFINLGVDIISTRNMDRVD